MAIDSTRKVTLEVVEAASELSKEAVAKGASVDAVAICGMLKLLIMQLGILTTTIAEKKCQR